MVQFFSVSWFSLEIGFNKVQPNVCKKYSLIVFYIVRLKKLMTNLNLQIYLCQKKSSVNEKKNANGYKPRNKKTDLNKIRSRNS